MTQDKELLLKDLCARLPYNIRVEYKGKTHSTIYDVLGVAYGRLVICLPFMSCTEHPLVEEVKPYLFPLSSMTEEQLIELKTFTDLRYEHNTLELVEWNDNYKTLEFWLEEIPSYCVIEVFDWLNKNHFDYRGLIERGLANDATGLNVY